MSVAVHLNSKSSAKVELTIPPGATLDVPAAVADQLVEARVGFEVTGSGSRPDVVSEQYAQATEAAEVEARQLLAPRVAELRDLDDEELLELLELLDLEDIADRFDPDAPADDVYLAVAYAELLGAAAALELGAAAGADPIEAAVAELAGQPREDVVARAQALELPTDGNRRVIAESVIAAELAALVAGE